MLCVISATVRTHVKRFSVSHIASWRVWWTSISKNNLTHLQPMRHLKGTVLRFLRCLNTKWRLKLVFEILLLIVDGKGLCRCIFSQFRQEIQCLPTAGFFFYFFTQHVTWKRASVFSALHRKRRHQETQTSFLWKPTFFPPSINASRA